MENKFVARRIGCGVGKGKELPKYLPGLMIKWKKWRKRCQVEFGINFTLITSRKSYIFVQTIFLH